MILKDVHKDVERYLNEDCYCIGEIYEANGFFCWVFLPSDTCKIIVKTSTKAAVVCRDRIILFDYDTNKIHDAMLIPVINEHNLQEVVDFVNEKKSTIDLTEDKPNTDSLQNMIDAIMI